MIFSLSFFFFFGLGYSMVVYTNKINPPKHLCTPAHVAEVKQQRGIVPKTLESMHKSTYSQSWIKIEIAVIVAADPEKRYVAV